MDSSDNFLEIPVTYKGQELSFPAQVLITGYSHRIQVDVEGQWIMFEPDEERNYRAILNTGQLDKVGKLDVSLLQAVAEVIESAINIK